jgi:hypothetical protein
MEKLRETLWLKRKEQTGTVTDEHRRARELPRKLKGK